MESGGGVVILALDTCLDFCSAAIGFLSIDGSECCDDVHRVRVREYENEMIVCNKICVRSRFRFVYCVGEDCSDVCCGVMRIVASKVECTQHKQAERLFSVIDYVLTTGNITYDQVDIIAVTRGPGSFTGSRIGLASVQGICCARYLRNIMDEHLNETVSCAIHPCEPGVLLTDIRSCADDVQYQGVSSVVDGCSVQMCANQYDTTSTSQLSVPDNHDVYCNAGIELIPVTTLDAVVHGYLRYACTARGVTNNTTVKTSESDTISNDIGNCVMNVHLRNIACCCDAHYGEKDVSTNNINTTSGGRCVGNRKMEKNVVFVYAVLPAGRGEVYIQQYRCDIYAKADAEDVSNLGEASDKCDSKIDHHCDIGAEKTKEPIVIYHENSGWCINTVGDIKIISEEELYSMMWEDVVDEDDGNGTITNISNVVFCGVLPKYNTTPYSFATHCCNDTANVRMMEQKNEETQSCCKYDIHIVDCAGTQTCDSNSCGNNDGISILHTTHRRMFYLVHPSADNVMCAACVKICSTQDKNRYNGNCIEPLYVRKCYA